MLVELSLLLYYNLSSLREFCKEDILDCRAMAEDQALNELEDLVDVMVEINERIVEWLHGHQELIQTARFAMITMKAVTQTSAIQCEYLKGSKAKNDKSNKP